MCGIMSFVIAVFLTTRNDQALDRPIWAKEPKTWPAVLLLTASLLTMVASIATVCYYCLYFKRANDSWKVVVLTYSIHIALWLVVTFLYRYEKDVSDLWGWSCTPIAAELQAKGNIRVDFTTLCHVQGTSWVLSIVEVSCKVFFAFITFAIYLKKNQVTKAKKRLAEGFGEGATGLLDFL